MDKEEWKELKPRIRENKVLTGAEKDLICELLEKQIPKKLQTEGFFKVCECGCEMSTFLMRNRSNYCPNCGQKIEWD